METIMLRRKTQGPAERAHNIALLALNRSPFVLLAGDFNDTPDSVALASLFNDGFVDISDHPDYPGVPADRPGTLALLSGR